MKWFRKIIFLMMTSSALLLSSMLCCGQEGKGVSVDFNGGQLLTEREYSRVIKKAVDSLASEGRRPVLDGWADSVELFLDNMRIGGTEDSIVFYVLSHETAVAGQDWKRAYRSLSRLEHITDSIQFEELHRQVRSVSHALHQAKTEADGQGQDSLTGYAVAVILLSAAVLALAAACVTLYSRLRKQRARTSMHAWISRDMENESVRQQDEIRELEGGMRKMKERQRQEERARKALAVMLQQKQGGGEELIGFTGELLKITGELANIYYESSTHPETLAKRVKETLGNGLSGGKAFDRIGLLVEASYPGFMQSLTDEFPWLADDDKLLISLMICGISSSAACVILNTDLNRLNIRKTWLAKKMNTRDRLSIYLRDKLYNWNRK